MKSHYDKHQEKEASGTHSVIEALQSRFDEMETHIHKFAAGIETLFEKERTHRRERQKRRTRIDFARSRETPAHSTSRQKRKACVPPSREAVRTAKQKPSIIAFRESAHGSQPDSQRGDAGEGADGDDDFSLHRALQRIEEARAKRRRSEFSNGQP